MTIEKQPPFQEKRPDSGESQPKVGHLTYEQWTHVFRVGFPNSTERSVAKLVDALFNVKAKRAQERMAQEMEELKEWRKSLGLPEDIPNRRQDPPRSSRPLGN